jgi:hypothetical protein
MKVSIEQIQLSDTRLMIKGVAGSAPKILTRALNKTILKGRTLSSKKIREQVNLKAAYVKSKISLKKASYSRLRASISAESRGLILTNYVIGADKNGNFKVKIKKKGGTKLITNAFLTTINAGSRKIDAIAVRDPATNKFKVLYGPSVSQVFNTVRDQVDAELVEYLAVTAEKELSAVLRGY